MKKQLSILAGSVLLASSAQALMTSNAVAVLTNTGGGTFIIDTGVSADALAAGTGFTLDVSSAVASLGSIDSYGVFGLLTPTATGLYNYDSGSYVDVGAGVVYASGDGGPLTLSQNDVVGATSGVSTYLTNASFGFNADGTPGDADAIAFITTGFGGLLIAAGDSASIFTQDSDFTGAGSLPEEVVITSPAGLEGVNLVGSTLSVAAVPVPAAAWLFGSALVGLGVVRRKS